MGITIPATLTPGNIIAPIEERYSLRSEKKRPCSIKTRRPFRGIIDKVEITFRESIDLAEKVARELGHPFKLSKNGRLQKYDPIKLAAALLVKGMRSFAHLSTDLKNIAYDL